MRISLILLLCFYSLAIFAQDRGSLEKQKSAIRNEIKFTNDLIAKTNDKKNSAYNKLLLINSNIRNRKKLIQSINEEIAYLDSEILVNQEVLQSLEKDLESYKKEYAQLVYAAFISNDTYNKIIFVLASESFNKAFNRMRYLRQYAKARNNLINEIMITQESVTRRIEHIQILKADKVNLSLEEQVAKNALENTRNDHKIVVQSLSKKEKELKLQLLEKQRIASKIQKEIEQIIAEEAKRLSAGKLVMELTPEEKELANVFELNKNKLPWPTERGVVTSTFGTHPHPKLKGVVIQNDGIDINTMEKSSVRAVYKGKVTTIFAIPGANKTVIIRHGNYLTVYSNLKDVIVAKGDVVDTKQVIGIAYTDNAENKTVIQFQIWRENVKLDPLTWLASR